MAFIFISFQFQQDRICRMAKSSEQESARYREFPIGHFGGCGPWKNSTMLNQ
jgi:hypothetical protein